MYTLADMQAYLEENEQDFLAPVLSFAIERIVVLEAENERLKETIRDVNCSGVSYDGPRYKEVQIDADLWSRLKESE